MQSLIFSLGILDNLTKPIGKIFQPLLDFVAAILAFFYSIIPNYPISMALLTIVIMAVLTPLTVKSTKSMAAMQALGPEMKKLQQKYKGAENRAQLNEEMMKLYKEHKVNPASGCLPMLLQMPAFLVLYDVIRGITNTVQVHGHTVAQPRYISHTTKMYHDIIAGHGQLNSFGMDFAKKL
ncbi:MAG TPA: membrane protein insertase YidC, partial [Acidimicrobiales bacterium]|nr:membrane protein insertase YidC [Acidimicrobiales bacterium]